METHHAFVCRAAGAGPYGLRGCRGGESRRILPHRRPLRCLTKNERLKFLGLPFPLSLTATCVICPGWMTMPSRPISPDEYNASDLYTYTYNTGTAFAGAERKPPHCWRRAKTPGLGAQLAGARHHRQGA